MNIVKKPVPTQEQLHQATEILLQACHARAYNNGWWHDLNTGDAIQRPIPECLCLIHSEISEALEGFRKNLMDDKITNRKMIEVELADALIRIFDLAGGYGYDLAGAMVDKTNYNDSRADHKPENRKLENGKKI